MKKLLLLYLFSVAWIVVGIQPATAQTHVAAIGVSWQKPTQTVQGNPLTVKAYSVAYRAMGETEWQSVLITDPDQTSYTLSGLDMDLYELTLQVFDDENCGGPKSTPVVVELQDADTAPLVNFDEARQLTGTYSDVVQACIDDPNCNTAE